MTNNAALFNWASAGLLLLGLCWLPTLWRRHRYRQPAVWNLVASQPPLLSEAQTVTLVSDGQVHVPIEQIRDGKLPRFVWVADDGKAVRFFVIHRYPDKLRLGVVFDACLLCGDQGYVMEGNQVICVACGVHIFIHSIGKPGGRGCNPVPIENWRNDARENWSFSALPWPRVRIISPRC